MNTVRIYLSIIVILIFNNVFGNLITPSKKVIHQKEFEEVTVLLVDNKLDDALKVLKSIKLEELDPILYYISLAQISLLNKDFSKSSYYINEAEKLAKATPDKLDDAYVFYGKGSLEVIYSQNNEATSNLLKAINLLKKYKDQEFYLGYCYYHLANIQTKVRLYSNDYKYYVEQSSKYAKESKNTHLLISTLVEKTLFYELSYNEFKKEEDLKKLFSLVDTLNKFVINPNNKDKLSRRLVIVFYNNLATYINTLPYENLSQNKRAEIAEKYIEKAEIELIKTPTLSYLHGLLYITHGEIKLNQGDKKAAEEYFLKVYSNINNFMGDNLYFYRLSTSLLSDLYKSQGDYKKALKFKDEEYKYSIQSYKQQSDDKTRYLQASFNTEQKNIKISQLEQKNKINTQQKILYIGISILAITGFVFLLYMLYYKSKLNKQKTDLLEAKRFEAELNLDLEKEEKARIKAEQQLLELQQEQLNKHALATSIQLNKKNSFLNDLKEKIKVDKDINLNKILKDERLADNNFTGIQTVLQEIHPNFFKKMNEISKNTLTTQDLNYAAYIYLNMDNQQISNILNVENKTVRMKKYRLKQKIGLDKNIDLKKFIQSLEL